VVRNVSVASAEGRGLVPLAGFPPATLGSDPQPVHRSCIADSTESVESYGCSGLAARRFCGTIFLNVFSKAAPVPSTPSFRAVSMNRSDCYLSVSLGLGFAFFWRACFRRTPLFFQLHVTAQRRSDSALHPRATRSRFGFRCFTGCGTAASAGQVS